MTQNSVYGSLENWNFKRDKVYMKIHYVNLQQINIRSKLTESLVAKDSVFI